MRSYLDHILKFLFVLVVISAAAALYLFNLQDKARASIGNIARNEAAFGCMQGKTELAVVEVALLEFLAIRTPATGYALTTSAQVLLSRIESLDSGAAGSFFRARPTERIRITQFRRSAESLEKLASVSTHADVRQGIGLVRDMWPTFEQLCTSIQQFSGDLLMEAKDTLSHSTTAFTYLLGGFLASGLALLAILFFQNKVVRRSLLTQRAIARENYRLANHDPLTGLGNRSLFSIALDALSRRTADDTYACLLMIDLDRFKLVNDNLGHSAGDALLISIATRLSQLEREDPAVQAYRLGGDEFVVLLRGATQQDQALELAHHVMQLLRPAHDLGGHTVAIAVSIGVATVPIRRFDPTTLFRHADLAVHEAKRQGRSIVVEYSETLSEATRVRMDTEQDMRRAISAAEFFPHYQPIVSLSSHKVVGVEALLRWAHPTRGMISPAEFIPIAEETGLIVEIGRAMIENVCRDIQAMPKDWTVSINLSPVQFYRDDVVPVLAEQLALHAIAPWRIELEITESLLMGMDGNLQHTLQQLRDLGVTLALDDFGTGYSSLSYLRTFRFDKLKIDRSFLTDIHTNSDARSIVKAIAEMARALGMVVTAEGVEIREQAMVAQLLKCDLGQGYYFAKPMALADAIASQSTSAEGDSVVAIAC